jgi:hypothetical protein
VGRRGIAAVLVVIVAAGLISGCGDDSSASITREQFTKQANSICERSNKERRAEFKALSAPKPNPDESWTEPEMAKVIEQFFVGPYGEMIDELEALGAPAGAEEQVDALLQAMEEGLEKTEDDPIGAMNNSALFKEVNELATKYGLTGCVL